MAASRTSDLAATMTREAPLLVPLVEASPEWIGCMRIYVSRRAARKKEDQWRRDERGKK